MCGPLINSLTLILLCGGKYNNHIIAMQIVCSLLLLPDLRCSFLNLEAKECRAAPSEC